jgi:hypothetical protein
VGFYSPPAPVLRDDDITVLAVWFKTSINLSTERVGLEDHVSLAVLLSIGHMVPVIIAAGIDLLMEAVEDGDAVSMCTINKLLEMLDGVGILQALCDLIVKLSGRMEELIVRIDENKSYVSVGRHFYVDFVFNWKELE